MDASPSTSTFSVSPQLGSEAAVKLLCLAGGDALGISKLGGVCMEDRRRGCVLDSDCGVGVCKRVCVELRVQMCRYCVRDGETLQTILGSFMVDTNWMRSSTLHPQPNTHHLTPYTHHLTGCGA